MLYALRANDGSILALAREQMPRYQPIRPDDAEVARFIQQDVSLPDFTKVDADFVRVLEDLIDVLISKKVLTSEDLPMATQHKILQRKSTRQKLVNSLRLFGDDSSII